MSQSSIANRLTPAQIVVLSKVLTEKELDKARQSLSAGKNEVEPFQVACMGGEITLGEDVEYTPTSHIPLLDTLVIAMRTAGFQREKISEMIISSASKALSSGSKAGDQYKADIAFVKADIEKLQTKLSASLPKAKRRGASVVKVKWI
jgi:hypothetical protein